MSKSLFFYYFISVTVVLVLTFFLLSACFHMKTCFSFFSSTSSFVRNLNNSQNSTPGFLSTILLRLLCISSLPTHPSDYPINEVNPMESDRWKNSITEMKIEASATPGVVARLMGLESMPDLNLVSTGRTRDSLGRSRSVNSFREIPTFLLLENDEFLLLSFENVDEIKELGSKGRKKYENCTGELKQRKTDKRKNKENRGERILEKKKKKDQECNKRVYNEKEKLENMIPDNPSKKFVSFKNWYSLKRVEPECNSENSSPVSVLDFCDFVVEPETLLSEDDSRRKNSNSRTKLSPNFVNSEYPSPHLPHSSISKVRELRSINGEGTRSTKMDIYSGDYLELWGKACKLAKEDMKNSNWMPREMWKMEDLEETGIGFGLQILDRLLHEIVIELAGIPMEYFAL